MSLFASARRTIPLSGLEHLTDEELEEIRGKCEGRAKAVLAVRTASAEAEGKLKVINGEARA